MRSAFRQARRYAQSLAEPPWPPFIIVLDVGRSFELYFDYAGNGRDYRFFPDRSSYRMPVGALAQQDKWGPLDLTPLQLLRTIWTNPRSLDPALRTADVTRDVARRLASVSASLEETQRLKTSDRADWERSLAIEETSLFLMRILFCMFAEDAQLLSDDPEERPFKAFLQRTLDDDDGFRRGLGDLWQKMGQAHLSDRWTFAFGKAVKYFNGSLFAETRVYELGPVMREELLAAARHEWKNVEPAIFGTLLEQALTPGERSKLGAHYTPRPYVERIVEATITDVLRPEWESLEASLEGLDRREALARLAIFHDRLTEIRVLDPACGTGNFLYVAMEALLGLENKLLQAIEDLGGEARSRVGPGQFHGLEKNPRAAKIAELVLWIGWLRWNIRNGAGEIAEPILGQRANINFGRPGGYDAVLAQDESGAPDLANPRQPEWPEADFVVGNPPFIGKGKDMREALGDQYVQLLARVYDVKGSADYVMYWWDRCASLLAGRTKRFGLISTNSIKQVFNRKVMVRHFESAQAPVSLAWAVYDHPWRASAKDAAVVRISMTVGVKGRQPGRLLEVTSEKSINTDQPMIEFAERHGIINVDLSVGADVTQSQALAANEGISWNGVMLSGRGFIPSASDVATIRNANEAAILKRFLSGKDVTARDRQRLIIDPNGRTERELRGSFPTTYSILLRSLAPERATKRDKGFRDRWWLFGRNRSDLREAVSNIPRFIVVPETSVYRLFQFVASDVLPEHRLVCIASSNAAVLGVLLSDIHIQWSLRSGGTLEDRPTYTKSRCFDPFPFPVLNTSVESRIADIAEELDSLRKTVLGENPKLTMTGLYNLVEKVRSGVPISSEGEREVVGARARIVAKLHEELDKAVAEAYGWPHDLAPAEIVARLVALNAQRKTEEEAGNIRWLRPDYQIPRFGNDRE